MACELGGPQRGQHDAAGRAAQHRQQAGCQLMDVPELSALKAMKPDHRSRPRARPPAEDALQAARAARQVRLALRPEGGSLAAELQAASA